MNPLPHFISGSHLNPVWGSPDVPVAILLDPLTWLLSPRTIPLPWRGIQFCLYSCLLSTMTLTFLLLTNSMGVSCFNLQGFGPQHCALHTRKVVFEEWFLNQQQLGICDLYSCSQNCWFRSSGGGAVISRNLCFNEFSNNSYYSKI